MHIYMAVTPDKLELPLAVGNTATELAKILRIKEDTIYTGISRNYSGKTKGMKFIKIDIIEESDDK
ncbi:hypothetical protein J2Z76_002606 [Sedimentibacter acidaminivorans]|uniref:DNA-binding protein n=1 Tax=Sedimentibacter acidaminivorans TaxID=913099 RepID=A0ABS4GGB4_9FIRM|nr:hypothetical protein [Sedimentibacter acidaminivorans]MBP1926736.1 hypothetical protein [Sedimentibacter acidaminivorans]